MPGDQIFSLQQVMLSIRKTLADRYVSEYWIKAEMNKLNRYSHSGHCYPELVEKDGNKVIAQVRSIIWKDDYNIINQKFLDVLKEPLKDGIKILFKAKITFDPVYGIALRITDIDPAFTLGDLEQEKLDTITRLKAEGVYDQNRSLSLSVLPQRIAIISVETSKGYADFFRVIDTNPWNYRFFMMLFPALLQGENAVQSIIAQLHRINKVKDHFDVVAIIRGGGGDVGLSCYNNYQLANEIARFPIPVITGIGHATNETVTEMVSFTNAITPTKIAEYLIQRFHNFSVPVQKAQDRIMQLAKQNIIESRTMLFSETRMFRSATKNVFIESNGILKQFAVEIARRPLALLLLKKQQINDQQNKIASLAKQSLRRINADLIATEKNINNLDPKNVMKRGYSIAYKNNKAISSVKGLSVGDEITIVVSDGIINSTIINTEHE